MAQELPSRPKVLVIEDNEAVIITLQILLHRENYEVIGAQTGHEGLELARTEQPDVILLDWILPDAEGPSLLAELRQVTQAPCIMVTAQDTPAHCVKALDAGCDDFVAKPIHPPELLLRLNRLLGERPAGTEEC